MRREEESATRLPTLDETLYSSRPLEGDVGEGTLLDYPGKGGEPRGERPGRDEASGGSDRSVLGWLWKLMGKPPIQLRLWDGWSIGPGEDTAVERLVFQDRGALWKVALNPEMQFGEMYTSGRVHVEGDLVKLLEKIYLAMARVYSPTGWLNFLERFRFYRTNSLERARGNIYHHYDIGNDFYRLWLDPEMLYTCAYFPREFTGLDEAQIAKMDHVARKLWLKPGERVVEAGCGWGSLALHLARKYGVFVEAYNISHEQLVYARERAQQAGLESRVRYIEADYREIQGQFDVFVSVGMLEHVGVHHYDELGQVIDRCLTPEGRGLIHSIGRDQPGNLNAWIRRRIFPGAQPPSLSQMSRIFEPRGLSVLDVENIRLHYAKTLEYWLQKYDRAESQVQAMFDADFVRAWRLYLAGSVAAFRTGSLQLFQVVFARNGCNAIPWTREHLYRG